MHVTEKLIRPLTEAKYLNADNVDRYRSIMRIFFEYYEKLIIGCIRKKSMGR